MAEGERRFVSRGGEKLEHALGIFAINVDGKIVIDVGASTGGFTDCLLKHGAAKVYAIDVGYGQLDWKLRNDPRVKVVERTNVRHLKPEDLYSETQISASFAALAAVDVSFISLSKVLPAIRQLLAPAGEVVTLVKPSFEARRSEVPPGGVIKDPALHEKILTALTAKIKGQGWAIKNITSSPLKGADGNLEFFLHLTQEGSGIDEPASRIKEIIAAAHQIGG